MSGVGGRASFDLAEQQQAFVGLLTRPLLSPEIDPELHRRVSRHRAVIGLWAGRLGYRLVAIGSTLRLRRIPIAHTVAAPAAPYPPRRELVLALLVAATLEDVAGETVTIQSISDAVRDAGALGAHTAYDPQRRADRVTLIRALGRLCDLGVLQRRTARAELIREWEDSGRGPGAGYRINRDALLLMVDPVDVAQARASDPTSSNELRTLEDDRDPRSATILRRLVETQGLLLDDLDDAEREYFRMQRQRLLARAAEMTGATVEVRREGVLLVLPPDGPHAKAATVDFPAVTTAAWVSLRLLDMVAEDVGADTGGRGRLRWSATHVDRACRTLHAEVGDRLTNELKVGPAAVRAAAEEVLAHAGLIDVTSEGDWLVSPFAGRYRDAVLHTSPRTIAPALVSESGT